MISAWKAIELADRSDDPSPFEFVHRAVAKMRESAAKPVEYAEAPQDLSPGQEEALYLAEEAFALESQMHDGDLVGTCG